MVEKTGTPGPGNCNNSQYPIHGGGGSNLDNGSGGTNGGTRCSGNGGSGSFGRVHIDGTFTGVVSEPSL